MNDVFNLKRKWQIALRRYVLEEKPSPAYAPYFGLPIDLFREWIANQFDESLNWSNFGKLWQFDHILPTSFFDLTSEQDLCLCWNFINIRVGQLNETGSSFNNLPVLAARQYFQSVYANTGYSLCSTMLDKISTIEAKYTRSGSALSDFISAHSNTLSVISTFTADDFERVNGGLSIVDLLAERELMARFK